MWRLINPSTFRLLSRWVFCDCVLSLPLCSRRNASSTDVSYIKCVTSGSDLFLSSTLACVCLSRFTQSRVSHPRSCRSVRQLGRPDGRPGGIRHHCRSIPLHYALYLPSLVAIRLRCHVTILGSRECYDVMQTTCQSRGRQSVVTPGQSSLTE